MRHFFKFAMFRQIKNIVAAVMQVIATFTHGAERRIARRNAESATDFFGLMTWVLLCRIVVSLILSSSLLSFVGSRLLSDATPCVLSDLQFSTPRRPDKSRQRRIRHRLSDATPCVLSDLRCSSPRRPDKSRQRRIRHRFVGCDAMRLIRPTVEYTRRPDKSRQRRIRHRFVDMYNRRTFYFTWLRANRSSSFSSYW